MRCAPLAPLRGSVVSYGGFPLTPSCAAAACLCVVSSAHPSLNLLAAPVARAVLPPSPSSCPPRDRISAFSRFRCRRAVSAARRIHGQDSRRFTFYHRQVGLPCIAQGGQSSPGRESPACFYPILSWAVYRTRFLASEGLPACLPLPVFPGCHPSLRAVTLPVSRHWSGYAGLHLPADGVSSPDRFGRPAGRDLHPPVGGTRTHRRERGHSLQTQSPPPWAAG